MIEVRAKARRTVRRAGRVARLTLMAQSWQSPPFCSPPPSSSPSSCQEAEGPNAGTPTVQGRIEWEGARGRGGGISVRPSLRACE